MEYERIMNKNERNMNKWNKTSHSFEQTGNGNFLGAYHAIRACRCVCESRHYIHIRMCTLQRAVA